MMKRTRVIIKIIVVEEEGSWLIQVQDLVREADCICAQNEQNPLHSAVYLRFCVQQLLPPALTSIPYLWQILCTSWQYAIAPSILDTSLTASLSLYRPSSDSVFSMIRSNSSPPVQSSVTLFFHNQYIDTYIWGERGGGGGGVWRVRKGQDGRRQHNINSKGYYSAILL